MKSIIIITLFIVGFISCISSDVSKSNTNSKATDLPTFKYNPNALELGIIKAEKIKCSVCLQEKNYNYQSSFYSTHQVENICPWCIKDGSAAKKYNGVFVDVANCEKVNREEFIEELTTKTPTYSSWQQEFWLAHCGEFCAFDKYVAWEDIEELKEELKSDLDEIKSDYDISQNELEMYLTSNTGLQGYLFQCLHCKKHRLTVDFE